MLPLIAFTQSTKGNTTPKSPSRIGRDAAGDLKADSLRTEARRLVNKLAALYEGCEGENEALQKRNDVCIDYQTQCESALAESDKRLAQKNLLLLQNDSIINMQQLQLGNFHKEVKDDKQIAIRRIAGFTVGGFLVGVSLPLIVYFFRK